MPNVPPLGPVLELQRGTGFQCSSWIRWLSETGLHSHRAKNRRPFLVYLEAYLLKVSCTQHKYDTMILQNRIPFTQIIELIELKNHMRKIAYGCSYLCNRKAELFISRCLNVKRAKRMCKQPRWHLCLYLGSPVTSLTWRNDTIWKVPVLILLHLTIRPVFKVKSTFTLT